MEIFDGTKRGARCRTIISVAKSGERGACLRINKDVFENAFADANYICYGIEDKKVYIIPQKKGYKVVKRDNYATIYIPVGVSEFLEKGRYDYALDNNCGLNYLKRLE